MTERGIARGCKTRKAINEQNGGGESEEVYPESHEKSSKKKGRKTFVKN